MTKTGKKRRFRPARFVLKVTASLLLVAAAILLLVRFGTFDRLILVEASRRLEAAAGLRIEAAKIVINPFSLSLRLKNPTLRAVAERGPLLREFSADSAFLSIPTSVIFGGRLSFKRVHLVRPMAVLAPLQGPAEKPDSPYQTRPVHTDSGPDIQVRRDTDAVPSAASAAPAGYDLRIDDFVLEDGLVTWKGRAESFSVSLENIDVRARYDPLQRNHIASLTASGGNLKYSDKDFGLELLDLKGRWGTGEIVVETFEVATGASSVSLTGTVKDYATAPEFSGQAHLSLSLQEIPLPTQLAAGAEGILAAEVSFSGKDGGLTYDAEVSTTGLRTRDLGSGTLAGRVRGDLTSLAVTGLDVRTEAGAVAGTFTADINRIHFSGVDLEWKELDPDRILSLFPFGHGFPVSIGSLVSGRLKGSAEPLSLEGIKGSVSMVLSPKQTRGTASSERASASTAEASPGLWKPPIRPSGEIALRASGGEFVLEKIRVTAAGAFLEASGSLRQDGVLDGRYSVRVESIPETIEALHLFGDLVPLQAGAAFKPENLAGSVFISGAIRGRPGATAFTAGIEIPELGYGNLLAKSLKADLEGDFNKLTVLNLSASVAGGTVRGSGTISLVPSLRVGALAPHSSSNRVSPPDSFMLELDKIQLAEIAVLLPEPWNKGTEGLFTGQAEVTTGRAGLSAPRGTFTLSITDLRAGSFTVPSVEIEARSDGRSAEASLRLRDFNAVLEAKLDLAPPYSIEGKLIAEGLPLDRLIRAAPAQARPRLDIEAAFIYPLSNPAAFSADIAFFGKDLRLGSPGDLAGPEPSSSATASIEGRILAAGDPSAPATFKVDGEIARFLVELGQVSLANPETIRFRIGEGILHIDSLILAGTAGSLSVSGTAGPFPGLASIEGRVHSDIDVSALSQFVPGMLVGGRLKADVDVRGGTSGRSFSGRAVLENAFVRTNDFPLILSGISAELSLEGPRLTLDRLEGTANGGPFRIQGGIDGLLSAVPPSARFTFDARNFQLEYPPGLHTTSDIVLALTG
ncbi:MAG: hypothetical protein MUQ25_13035, partial [Candidatus Aminicenantes bacterium]|nr:hypothetical protein [Candidatus Aminicenantes bacterium]